MGKAHAKHRQGTRTRGKEHCRSVTYEPGLRQRRRRRSRGRSPSAGPGRCGSRCQSPANREVTRNHHVQQHNLRPPCDVTQRPAEHSTSFSHAGQQRASRQTRKHAQQHAAQQASGSTAQRASEKQHKAALTWTLRSFLTPTSVTAFGDRTKYLSHTHRSREPRNRQCGRNRRDNELAARRCAAKQEADANACKCRWKQGTESTRMETSDKEGQTQCNANALAGVVARLGQLDGDLVGALLHLRRRILGGPNQSTNTGAKSVAAHRSGGPIG